MSLVISYTIGRPSVYFLRCDVPKGLAVSLYDDNDGCIGALVRCHPFLPHLVRVSHGPDAQEPRNEGIVAKQNTLQRPPARPPTFFFLVYKRWKTDWLTTNAQPDVYMCPWAWASRREKTSSCGHPNI